MTALLLLGWIVAGIVVLRIVVWARATRSDREEARRVAWKYLAHPAHAAQRYQDPVRVVRAPTEREDREPGR